MEKIDIGSPGDTGPDGGEKINNNFIEIIKILFGEDLWSQNTIENSINFLKKLKTKSKESFLDAINSISPTIKNYQVNETLTDDLSNIYRFYNGSIFQYIGTLPFTTVSIEDEGVISETNLEIKWKNLISTYPQADYVIFEPLFLAPSTTRDITFRGSFLRRGTVVNFGSQIIVNSYIYISETEFIVNVTASSNLGSYTVKINNGKELTLTAKIRITNGQIIVPGQKNYPWINSTAGIVTSLGEAEKVTVAGWDFATFSDGVLPNQDCIISFRLRKNYEAASQISLRIIEDQENQGNHGTLIFTFRIKLADNDTAIQNDGLFELLITGNRFERKRDGAPFGVYTVPRSSKIYPSFMFENLLLVKDVKLNLI